MPDPSISKSKHNTIKIVEPPPLKKRTLEQIWREIEPLGFPYDVAVSLWHRCHGRLEEAEDYFQTYLDEEEEKRVYMSEKFVQDMKDLEEAAQTKSDTEYIPIE